jgi:uncharacterized protein
MAPGRPLGPIPAPDPPPLRRRPDIGLPAYRYVPGLQPHPFRHAGGHRHLHGQAWPAPLWSPDADWRQDAPWLHGLDLFDQRFYWESHECWEAVWHAIDRDHVDRQLVQGLIQAAAFVIKKHCGTQPAAGNLLMRSIGRLETVQRERGSVHRGLDLPGLVVALRAFDAGGPWPCVPMAK